MSYLSQPATTTEFGVVQIGDYITVTDGVISLKQDLTPTSSVTFADVNVTGNLYMNNDLIVSAVTPTAGAGISLTDLDLSGANIKFKISNTGVLSLTAGTGIALSASTGAITISSTGTETINTVLVTTPTYTASTTDQYIGVNSTTPVTITLPAGTPGRTYYVKDEHGQGSGKITVQGQISELVDGATKYIISVPYQCIGLVFRGTSWHIL